MKKANIISSFILFLLMSFHVSAQKNVVVKKDYNFDTDFHLRTTPNCLFLNDTLMCDRTEMSNIDWKEFLAYTSKIYGKNSIEYKQIYPDTSGFIMQIDAIEGSQSKLSRYDYLWSPKYDGYPLVGITLNQAKKFSKWRSDRVFEMYLIQSGIIKFRKDQTSESIFTTEKYLNSKTAQKNKDIVTHYPEYYIPGEQERKILKNKILRKGVSISDIISIEKGIINERESGIPMKLTRNRKNPIQENVLYNILGNVAEMIDIPNTTFGGSYEDDLIFILKMEKVRVEIPSQKVGFRNFCKWIKIEN